MQDFRLRFAAQRAASLASSLALPPEAATMPARFVEPAQILVCLPNGNAIALEVGIQ